MNDKIHERIKNMYEKGRKSKNDTLLATIRKILLSEQFVNTFCVFFTISCFYLMLKTACGVYFPDNLETPPESLAIIGIVVTFILSILSIVFYFCVAKMIITRVFYKYVDIYINPDMCNTYEEDEEVFIYIGYISFLINMNVLNFNLISFIITVILIVNMEYIYNLFKNWRTQDV